jgi:ATP-binding protein involved in chromosome partitioning
VVENMSWFSPPDQPERRYPIFGSGGGQTLAQEAGVPLLGQIPMELPVQEGGDSGRPVTLAQPESTAATALQLIARRLLELTSP